jgi:hypothetical protein
MFVTKQDLATAAERITDCRRRVPLGNNAPVAIIAIHRSTDPLSGSVLSAGARLIAEFDSELKKFTFNKPGGEGWFTGRKSDIEELTQFIRDRRENLIEKILKQQGAATYQTAQLK